MSRDDESMMTLAISEGEHARGKTGDNPWVGCVISGEGAEVVSRGCTQGPGEDHAEIVALAEAKTRGVSFRGSTLYSTLEPCAFHGRTPACARVIVERGIGRVVIGMRDPHPRVDGEGIRILRDAGIEVVEGVCEALVRRQLGSWVLTYHPHEPARRARSLAGTLDPERLARALAETYAIDLVQAEGIVRSL